MDAYLKNAIQELKEKMKNQESSVNCGDVEKCLREFITELYIKREEVKQLRTDMEGMCSENKQLINALDIAKRTNEEKQFNLNILQKKTQNLEEELFKKRDALTKLKMQHTMTAAEIDTLKEKLQTIECEKNDFARKLEMYEAKQRHNTIYHNEIMKRDINLRNFIDEINETVTKLKAEHAEAVELSKKSDLVQEALGKLQFLSKSNEELKKQKEYFEEQYVYIQAKYEKLEELFSAKPDVKDPSIITKIIFNQWRSSRAHYEQQMNEKNDILTKLTEAFNSEKSTNIKLIYQNEELNRINVKLENENGEINKINKKILDELENKKSEKNVIDNDAVKIKDEPIEIDD